MEIFEPFLGIIPVLFYQVIVRKAKNIFTYIHTHWKNMDKTKLENYK